MQWIALDNGKLEVIFRLNGASPNHRYIAGAHFYDPEGSTQLPAVCQFGGTKITCNREYQTREGATATIVGSWDFGYLETNGNGYGKSQFTLSPPADTYFAQFTLRIGDQCNPANGSTSGCAVVYRTGTKMGQAFEKIIIPSAQLQNPMIPLQIIPLSIVKIPTVTQCDWTGTWDAEFGQIILQQSGESITGSYSKNGGQGQIQGTVSGNVLDGSWTETNSRAGTFYFTMATDCQSFTGSWLDKKHRRTGGRIPGGGKIGTASQKVEGRKSKK